MNLKTITIAEYLEKVNSINPIPSAGPTLAVSGAFGLSLLGMAARITLKKRNEEELRLFVDNLDDLLYEMLDLGEKDIKSVSAFLKKEKGAIANAIDVPLNLARLCLKTMLQFSKLIEKCYAPVKGDAEAGMLLLKTCCEGNLKIAEANFPMLDDGEKRKEYEKVWNELKKKFALIK